MRMRATLHLAFLWMFATGCGEAHDFYILPDRFNAPPLTLLNLSFNNGDSFPKSENYPIPSRLRDARLLTEGAAPILVEHIRVAGTRLRGTVRVGGTAAGSAIIAARTEPHLIVLSPEKFLAYLREEGLNDVIAWRDEHQQTGRPGRERYSKYAKALLRGTSPDDFVHTAIGDPLEIVPESSVDAAKVPSAPRIQVLFRGAPAQGLAIESAWAGPDGDGSTVVGQTDAQGRISIPIAHRGFWRIHALKMERCADPAAADWESFWASLTFEVVAVEKD